MNISITVYLFIVYLSIFVEHATLFTKYVKLMLNQMSDSAKLESNIVYTDRWPHFVCICKHAYEVSVAFTVRQHVTQITVFWGEFNEVL